MATTALVLSLLSIVISVAALSWNVYRDVFLKPRVKVRMMVAHIFGPLSEAKKITVTAVNHGPGNVTIQGITIRDTSLWRRLRRKTNWWFVIPENNSPYGTPLPRALEPGGQATVIAPYDQDCFLNANHSQVGLTDSFGRAHWAPKSDLARAHKQYAKDFGGVPASENPESSADASDSPG